MIQADLGITIYEYLFLLVQVHSVYTHSTFGIHHIVQFSDHDAKVLLAMVFIKTMSLNILPT